MTFVEKYQHEKTWFGKALVMSLFHITMSRKGSWTITKTAEQFQVSIGLVSENLRLANAIDKYPHIAKLSTRQEALDKLRSMG